MKALGQQICRFLTFYEKTSAASFYNNWSAPFGKLHQTWTVPRHSSPSSLSAAAATAAFAGMVSAETIIETASVSASAIVAIRFFITMFPPSICFFSCIETKVQHLTLIRGIKSVLLPEEPVPHKCRAKRCCCLSHNHIYRIFRRSACIFLLPFQQEKTDLSSVVCSFFITPPSSVSHPTIHHTGLVSSSVWISFTSHPFPHKDPQNISVQNSHTYSDLRRIPDPCGSSDPPCRRADDCCTGNDQAHGKT